MELSPSFILSTLLWMHPANLTCLRSAGGCQDSQEVDAYPSHCDASRSIPKHHHVRILCACTGEPHPDWPAQWATSKALLFRTLQEAAEESRPFDGVLGMCALRMHTHTHARPAGFSNGAAAAATLLAEAVDGEFPPLRFGLFAGGYLPSHLVGAPPVAVASLHMVGAADEMVPPEQQRQLQDLFEAPRVYCHDQARTRLAC